MAIAMVTKLSRLRLPVLSLFCLFLVGSVGTVGAAQQVTSQTNVKLVDAYGQGSATFTVFYGFPQTAQVGDTLTIPIKLNVDNFTGLMNFLSSYNVTMILGLSNGKTVTGTQGVSGNQAAENLGALQLRAGQAWGPVNITIPLTETNTGLSQGQEALVNVTVKVNADIYLQQPINFYRPELNSTFLGYMLIQNGVPAGPAPNYAGFALLGVGLVLLVAAVVMRPKAVPRHDTTKGAPGAV